ncbi:hypothetical protein CYMTET_7409 [Cymbomonas tetramitiformis]|uniref:RING-type E3 ubiquitin transferase n=1 Tax=Cymbomonas tetramitiformis TaxID=36881 RepID=A0AAE0GVQ6_9CHLO|nr:hypothetical protein CYMTET_7409 [Cymbomonas tetramitiformis]
MKHVRRVTVSTMVYGNLTVLLVYAPAQCALRLAPAMFPLRLELSDPFMEVPFIIMLFNLLVTFNLEQLRPLTFIRGLFWRWLLVVGRALRLDDFLLPVVEGLVHGDPGRTVPVVIRLAWHDEHGQALTTQLCTNIAVGVRQSTVKVTLYPFSPSASPCASRDVGRGIWARAPGMLWSFQCFVHARERRMGGGIGNLALGRTGSMRTHLHS